MHVIIGGCGRVGAEIADRLSGAEHDVVVVDTRAESFDRIGSAFNGETLVGDVTDKDALVRAGIEKADALAAVTDLDNANLMAVQIARELFAVPYTVARLFNPQREGSYRKMGVHYVSGTRLVAKAILNELQPRMFPQHITFEDSDVEVVEMVVAPQSGGITVSAIEGRGDVRVAAIRRGARVRIPSADDQLQAGDFVVAAVRGTFPKSLRGVVVSPLEEG